MSLSENQGSLDNKAPEDTFSTEKYKFSHYANTVWLHEITILFVRRTVNWLFGSNTYFLKEAKEQKGHRGY